MPAKAIELDGKRYVILPEEEYEAMQRQRNGSAAAMIDLDDPMTEEEEAMLVRELERRRSEPSEPYDAARRELGLE